VAILPTHYGHLHGDNSAGLQPCVALCPVWTIRMPLLSISPHPLRRQPAVILITSASTFDVNLLPITATIIDTYMYTLAPLPVMLSRLLFAVCRGFCSAYTYGLCLSFRVASTRPPALCRYRRRTVQQTMSLWPQDLFQSGASRLPYSISVNAT